MTRLILNVYVPHRGRKAPPFMEDTMEQVANLVREKRKASDCVVVMGDMNGRLQRGDTGSKRVGPYTPHERGDEGGCLMGEMMEEFDLWAPLTFFKPASSREKGRGTRLGNATYVMEKRLPKTLKKEGVKARAPAMLDYVLMSRRYRSSVSNAQVKWGASMYKRGMRYDHGLLEIQWRFRVRCSKKGVPNRDYTALKDEKIRPTIASLLDEHL